jgi:fibronectin-binding autotransporter adhesin
MQDVLKCVSAIGVGLGLVACSSGTQNPPVDSGTGMDSGLIDSPIADTGADSSSADSSAEAGSVTLTVMNFLSWCSVSINGGASSTGANATASVTGGSTATIVITPASGAFQIGGDPWMGVDQNGGGPAPGVDVGSGSTETSTATVTITKTGTTQCVSVCCQEPNNSPTPCPTTNPCP